jgi:hypothetical protein
MLKEKEKKRLIEILNRIPALNDNDRELLDKLLCNA